MNNKQTAFIGLFLILSAIFITTNFVISGAAVTDWKKPQITYDEKAIPNIQEEHITYLVAVLEGEELSKIPLTNNYPQMEVFTLMRELYFTSYVVDGEIQTYPGKSLDPDIKVRIGEDTLADVVKSSDPIQTIKTAKKNGKIGIEILSGYTELFLKGYLKIYNNFK